MRSILRNVIWLIISIVVFLLVLGTLIWQRNMSIDTYTFRNVHFFDPSRRHLAQARRELDQVIAGIFTDVELGHAQRTVPYRFRLQSSMKAIDSYVTEVVRLADEFEYDGAFNLQSRAYRQFKAVRDELLRDHQGQWQTPATIVDALAPLRSSLAQLARIYDLDHLDWQERERGVIRTSNRNVMAAIVVLLFVGSPIFIGMIIGLRRGVEHESRIRNDLEEARKNLETIAMYDELTGLGNRNLFKSRLEQIDGAGRRSAHHSALLYIDLDNFKRINDSLGHDVGDEVLKVIGARLKQHVRAGDTVARIGGDEFTIILYGIDRDAVVGSIARKLLESIRKPVMAFGNELVLSASMGITVVPGDGNDPAALMKNADMALYRAKDKGRNNFQFFVEEMNRAATHQAMLERELRAALREQRFELHYQPQVALDSGTVATLEALLRWNTTDGQTMAPDQFLPVAESTGLLVEIGGWVFTQACRDLAALRARGHDGLRVAVNLSARQLHDPELLSRIEAALAAAGLAPDVLEVEITETTLIEDIDGAVEILQSLRRLGITVAVDDFGIGYSSLSYLKRLPLDTLKIDRSFVRDIESDEDDRSIVDAILAMGRSLSLNVVAEGIENQWQLDYVTQRGCDLAQGYLLARPVARDQLTLSTDDATPGARHPPARGGLYLV